MTLFKTAAGVAMNLATLCPAVAFAADCAQSGENAPLEIHKHWIPVSDIPDAL